MAFCDLFNEFILIRVDENIHLRQHEPEKDARPFWEIYVDEEDFTHFGGYKSRAFGMKNARFVRSKAV